jgi:hypothetical protein
VNPVRFTVYVRDAALVAIAVFIALAYFNGWGS